MGDARKLFLYVGVKRCHTPPVYTVNYLFEDKIKCHVKLYLMCVLLYFVAHHLFVHILLWKCSQCFAVCEMVKGFLKCCTFG